MKAAANTSFSVNRLIEAIAWLYGAGSRSSGKSLICSRRSVYENIAMGMRWRGLAEKAKADRVDAVADLLEIDDLKQMAGKLSRGWAQRVALARALALEPDLILLDEPLSALDSQIRARLLDRLKLRLSAEGRSAVYVTHGRDEAASLADKAVSLSHGRLA